MESRLRVALFNTQHEQAHALREVIAHLSALELALETSGWDDLEACLRAEDEGVGLLVVNLDPDIESGQRVVNKAARAAPEVSIIGISTHTDPETIISSMRAGCTQFVCAPIDGKDFKSAVESIRSMRTAPPQASRRVCVVGASGGVGATTVACNLALELAQVSGRTSALVDLNLEYGDVSFNFDCTPKYSVADVCDERSTIDKTFLESALHALPCDVALLCRPEKLADAHRVTPEGVEQALRALSQMFANVVIDVPRMFSYLNSPALDRADLVMIVAQLSVSSLRNASRVFDLLLEMGLKDQCLELVLNRTPAEYQRVTVRDVEEHFGKPMFALIPNDYRRVTASLDFGQPIVADSPNSPARLAFHELAKSIIQSRHADAGGRGEGAGKGLFKRWLGRGKKEPAGAR